jgi:heme/copper-type cytochrome/quinol oxidase subunit 3
VAYLYLRSKAVEWPPNVAPPPLLWGTLNTAVLLASCVPNHFTKKAAEDENPAGGADLAAGEHSLRSGV